MADPKPQVLVLGADGFIGRHVAFALRASGWDVLACARRTGALTAMGFRTLQTNLLDPECSDPAFWRTSTKGLAGVVNCAGLLSAPQKAMQAVHVDAPKALYASCATQTAKLLVSAIGIEEGKTPFARYRLMGEEVAAKAGAMILRPGLVLADTSYGGSSLARALALFPWRRPVVGDGTQPFNPLHASDLAAMIAWLLEHPCDPRPRAIGGADKLTQNQLGAALRAWMGRPAVPALKLPIRLARGLGRIGDILQLGPISFSSVQQLESGIFAPTDPGFKSSGVTLRGATDFLNVRPAGTQDLWHARTWLLRPLVRLTLAMLWLASGILGLLLPATSFLPLVPGWPDSLMIALARAGGVVDIAIAAALLRNWKPRETALVQIAMVLGYTIAFTLLAPSLWLLPLGGLLKNLPILVLLVLHLALTEER